MTLEAVGAGAEVVMGALAASRSPDSAVALKGKSMVVRGVKELILAIEDCLQPFEDGDDLRPDDGEEVRWVAACEGGEGQC